MYNFWGGSRFLQKGVRLKGGEGILPRKILEFLVLGYAFSGILGQSQRVLMSHFLKLKFHYFRIKI